MFTWKFTFTRVLVYKTTKNQLQLIMTTDIVTVQLVRENEKEKWGFQISGGKDQDCPLVVSEVRYFLNCLKDNLEHQSNKTSSGKKVNIFFFSWIRLLPDQLPKGLVFECATWSSKSTSNLQLTWLTKKLKLLWTKELTILL